jgi:hypothetical protein
MPGINEFYIADMGRFKYWIKKNFCGWLYRSQTAAGAKAATESWLKQLVQKPVVPISDASYDVFTYHGEDGILLYLLHQMKDVPPSFVDIGSGDCIKSNCANLAVHFGWTGIFIDQNEKQLSIGKNFYKKRIAAGAAIKFTASMVSNENVNDIIREGGTDKNAGLLSIDIDGNDYWIWKAIEVIQPRIVVIEAKVEFGYKDIVVPCGKHNHHSVDKLYNGASVMALQKLGIQKGYKLVGANKQGYNLFFVKNDEPLPAAAVQQILADTGTKESFYPESFFNEHEFITIQ